MKTNRVLLNRPVFTQTAFDSRALTVLTTLLHRFPEAGRYQVRVQRGERREQQFEVQVSADYGAQQVNIDLATLNLETSGGCGCEPKNRYELAVGGVLGFLRFGGCRAVQRERFSGGRERKSAPFWTTAKAYLRVTFSP